MFEPILSYIWRALSATVIQILILLGPGLLLTIILNFETGFVQRHALNIIGKGWYLGLFGWLGTIVHELGHAIFCIIFGHKITELKLFHPDPKTGTLGYVKHSYNSKNIYQLAGNFFIGIGPIVLGSAVIYLLSYWLLGLNPFNLVNNLNLTSSQINSWDAIAQLLHNLGDSSGLLLKELFSWQHLFSWHLYVFIYMVFAIGSSITLSPSDIRGALGGFIVIVILIFILNLVTVWAGNFITDFVVRIAGYCVMFYAIVFLIILLNVAVAMFVLFLSLENH